MDGCREDLAWLLVALLPQELQCNTGRRDIERAMQQDQDEGVFAMLCAPPQPDRHLLWAALGGDDAPRSVPVPTSLGVAFYTSRRHREDMPPNLANATKASSTMLLRATAHTALASHTHLCLTGDGAYAARMIQYCARSQPVTLVARFGGTQLSTIYAKPILEAWPKPRKGNANFPQTAPRYPVRLGRS